MHRKNLDKFSFWRMRWYYWSDSPIHWRKRCPNFVHICWIISASNKNSFSSEINLENIWPFITFGHLCTYIPAHPFQRNSNTFYMYQPYFPLCYCNDFLHRIHHHIKKLIWYAPYHTGISYGPYDVGDKILHVFFL